MRLLIAVFFIVGLAGPAGTANSQTASYEKAYVPYTTIRPCDYWRYESSSGNYVCGFNPYRINVVEASDVETIVNALEQRIAELEARIAELEQTDD